MDHPSLYGALAQQNRLRSAAVSPSVSALGARRHLASDDGKPVATSGFGSFAVRSQPYAPGRISAAEPQALQQLLTAFLIRHGTHM